MFSDDNETKGRKILKEFGNEFGLDKTAFIKTDLSDKRLLESMRTFSNFVLISHFFTYRQFC